MKKLLPIFLTILSSYVIAQDLVITEIMYNPPESGTDTLEFIEISNLGSTNIFLGGYQFTQGVSGAFPNVTLLAGGTIVFSRDSLRFATVYGISGTYTWATGGLSNSGEDIVFVDNQGNTVDSVDYDNASPWPSTANGGGYSIVFCDSLNDNATAAGWLISADTISGLIINGMQVVASPGSYTDAACDSFACSPVIVNLNDTIVLGDSIMLGGSYQHNFGTYTDIHTLPNGCDSIIITQLFITLVASPFEGDIVITEIMYNPPESGTDSLEFIEIYNAGPGSIALDGFYFYRGVNYTFPPNTGLFSGAYITVCMDSNAFVQVYNTSPKGMWTSSGLGNSGETIILVDNNNKRVDMLDYKISSPWPGSSANGGGHSIVLCDSYVDNDNGANWMLSNDSIPGGVVNGTQMFASPNDIDVLCTVTSVSVNQSSKDLVKYIFNNPVQDVLSIRADKETQFDQINVYSTSGTLLMLQNNSNNSNIEIDLSSLSSGVYFIQLMGDKEVEILKVLKN